VTNKATANSQTQESTILFTVSLAKTPSQIARLQTNI